MPNRSFLGFAALAILVVADCRCGNPPCNAETCVGCCGSDGLCHVGGVDAYCGTSGAACADCTSQGQSCVVGECRARNYGWDAGPTDSGTPDAGFADGGDAGTRDGGDAGATDGGPTDGGADAGPSDGGVVCGAAPCSTAEVCCLSLLDGGVGYSCAVACADGGIPIMCDGPEDCPTAGDVCCGQLDYGAGIPPACPLVSASALCTATCTSSLSMTCPGSGRARFCHRAADCANEPAGWTSCCQFLAGTAPVTFCVTPLLEPYATQCFP